MSLSPEEKRYYGQLFKTADKERVGVITGDVAVKFFERSGLPAATLGVIWEISDKDNTGFLTQQSFSVALRLIGQAQNGREPDANLAKQPGPFPTFSGIDAPAPTPSAGSRTNSAPQPPKSRGVIPPLTPEDRAKYLNSWSAINPSSELLDGERARDVFQKSRLPVEQLGQIWALTDTRQRGALDQTEFIVAMHLVQSMMSGTVKSVPPQLPPGLFDAAASGPPAAASARSQRQQSSISSVRSQEPLQQQYSGQRQTVPMRSQLTGPPNRGQQQNQPQQNVPVASQQGPAADWDIKPHEKANYDNLFNDLDKSQKGYILGEEAVDFFSQSKLPHDDLAKVWDLTDADQSGKLTKDWFAVAMHLIKGKLGGKDIPPMLPMSLVPPASRPKMQAPTAAVFAEAQSKPVQPSSAAADLFGLNDSFSAPAPSQSPPASAFTDNFGGIDRVASPETSAVRSLANHRAAPPPPRAFGGQAAFVPSSSFGQSIQQGQTPAQPVGPVSQSRQPEQDLLSDTEPTQSRSLNNDSTEVANLNNQMSSLTNQQQQTRQERQQIETDINNMSGQKAELTTRLAHIREAYDQEVKTVRAMQVEQGKLRTETRELVKEASLLEASLDAVKQQHDTIAAQLEKDRTDNASIKERIKSANDQTATLKATLEKVQKEAKQQRGLVAINTKQLNTLEAGHETLNTQIEAVQAETAEQKRIAAIEEERSRANLEQSRSAMVSPALSTASASTNPFHRAASPAVASNRNVMSSFEQIFSQSGHNQAAPSTTFQAVAPAAAGGALAGITEAADAVSFGEDNKAKDIAPVNTQRRDTAGYEDDFSSSYDTAPTTANSLVSPTLSGFDNAFQSTPAHASSDQPGFSQPPAFAEAAHNQDAPKDSAPAEFQRYEHNAPEFNNESHDAQVADRQIASPVPVTAQTQSYSDPFTADARVASPSLQDTMTRPMPAAVANLATASSRSDDGSVGTSVRAQAPASTRETPANSRPSTPSTADFGQAAQPAAIESATEEHELRSPVAAQEVQETLSNAPQNDFTSAIDNPARALSPPAVPGAFPKDEDDTSSARQQTVSSQATAPSSNFFNTDRDITAVNDSTVSSYTAAEEHAQEVESSDDETIEQPRGADYYTRSTSAQATITAPTKDSDTSSNHTITREDVLPHQSSATTIPTSTITSANTTSAPLKDDFDEFDDLEEAEEADEEDMASSFTTNNNDFDTSFDAPSARSSYAPGSNILSTPVQLPPRVKDELNPSPARDFSEFSHYGSVLGEPVGLAPAIREPDAVTTTASSGAHAPPASAAASNVPSNLLQYTPQGRQAAATTSANTPASPTHTSSTAPAPPASRYGASLSPKRPEATRAISAADDPMLTELMDMGFSRDKSVGALEKFNYDLGAATEWLLKGN